MKNFRHLLTLIIAGFITVQSSAQCGPRYESFIFADSVVSDIQYGSNLDFQGNNVDLFLDIYFPKGDVETARPLVIMAHGGSFVGGSKTGSDVVPLCQDLTSMGYVVASIDYRVGMDGLPFPGPDSTDAAEAVVRASQDGNAAVRFFKDSYANGNPYGIDTSMIYFSGVSAGGFIALNVAYLDKMSEFPNWIDTTNPGLSGAIQGASGTPGYSSNVSGVINIAGAIRDTSWIEPGDVPLCSFHGDQDNTVPYGTETITLLGTFPLLIVSGSGSIDIRADNIGLTNCLETHEGQDHVPHVNNADYYDTTITIMRNFLVHLVCNQTLDCNYGPEITAVASPIASSKSIDIFPNPANGDNVMIKFDNKLDAVVSIRDIRGREILRKSVGQGAGELRVKTGDLGQGTYLVTVTQGETRKTGKLVIH